jgi:hypothetical protein
LSVEIVLSPEQLSRALAEAERRQAHNESKRLKGRNGAPANGSKALELHRLGCIGELAVAVYLGLEGQVFVEESAVDGSADLPRGIDVKTRPKHGYDLLVPLYCNAGHNYVLVTHERSTKIIGWLPGSKIALHENIKEPIRGRPCYMIPQSSLNPIETLP